MHVELASFGERGRLRGMKKIALALAAASFTAGPANADAAPSAQEEAQAQIERIQAHDAAGPMLNAVLAYDRDAAAKAREIMQSPLQGRTVLVKDNIATPSWRPPAGSTAT